jgi:hypothetical protein
MTLPAASLSGIATVVSNTLLTCAQMDSAPHQANQIMQLQQVNAVASEQSTQSMTQFSSLVQRALLTDGVALLAGGVHVTLTPSQMAAYAALVNTLTASNADTAAATPSATLDVRVLTFCECGLGDDGRAVTRKRHIDQHRLTRRQLEHTH